MKRVCEQTKKWCPCGSVSNIISSLLIKNLVMAITLSICNLLLFVSTIIGFKLISFHHLN